MKRVLAALLLAALGISSRVCDADDGERGPREALAELEAREPTVQDVRAAAVRHAGLAPERRASWARRARLAGLLPNLTARITRSFERDDDATHSSDTRVVDYADDLVIELRATWDLPRLVFDGAELSASREGARLALERAQLESEVTRLYYQRRRSQLEWIVDVPVDPVDVARRTLEMDELTANLDALTGGWLTREIARMERE